MSSTKNNNTFKNLEKSVTDPTTAALEAKIQVLNKELTKLKSELYKKRSKSIKKSDKPKPSIQLDSDLQKQILMLTEAMPHMVWIADSEGNCVQANSRYYELTGFSEESDDGWTWAQALHPEDLKRSIEIGNIAAEDNEPFSLEVRVKNKSNQYIWHLMHSIPFLDSSSNSTKWFGTTTNIHEQKVTQQKLSQGEKRFRRLLDAIPQIVFVCNPDGSIKFWNHRWYEFSGFTKEQSRTDAWQLLIHPEDIDNYLKEWKEALNSGDTFEKEFRLKRSLSRSKDTNGYLWHLARAVSFQNAENKIEQWFGTWTEIDAQKRS